MPNCRRGASALLDPNGWMPVACYEREEEALPLSDPTFYETALRIADSARAINPNGDYRWLLGTDVVRNIFLTGVSLKIADRNSPEMQEWRTAKRAQWDGYAHLLPAPEPQLGEFCKLPAAFRFDAGFQRNVGILLRDGLPCGAIHCEVDVHA